MTHPFASPESPSENIATPEENSHSHSSGNEESVSVTSPAASQLVDDYLLVPQDAPLDERKAVYTNGDLYTILASSIETDFNFNAFDFFVPFEGGPPPHLHSLEHEAFFVEEGEVSFTLGNEAGAFDVPEGEQPEEYILEGVPEGTFVFGPRLLPHGFTNPDSSVALSGSNPGARIFSITAPGGLDLSFESGVPVTDRQQPILPPPSGADPLFVEIVQRTGGGFASYGYEVPPGTPDYMLVLPEDASPELETSIREQVGEVEGFSVYAFDDRPTFTGPFEIEYTSLSTLEETTDELGNQISYNQFSLTPQIAETNIAARLSNKQVVEPTNSSATGFADLQLNEAGEIEYSLTLSELDLGSLTETATSQTPDNELDDVTAIHLHSGDRDNNGSHKFNILDPEQQQETELNIVVNDDGTTTVSGVWSDSEAEIPNELKDFIGGDGLPGTESDYYLQVHTAGNPEGEIRGQIALTSNDFPEPIVSEDYEVFYVREGTLSFEIDGETRLAEANTFVYVAPGNEYSLANFGSETVKSLAVTIPAQPEPDTVFGLPDSPFPSPLSSQATAETVSEFFLNDAADLFDRPNESNRRVYAGGGNDELIAQQGDRLFGEAGDDLLDASTGKSNNLIDGGAGSDLLVAGRDGVLAGGSGDDILRIGAGGNNLLYGNEGTDQFWLVNGKIPDSIVEERQLTEFGLADLTDTRNTVADFELGVDKIGIANIEGIDSFEDLKLLPAFGDIQSTSIIAEVDGLEGEISLGNLADISFNLLSADDFVFE